MALSLLDAKSLAVPGRVELFEYFEKHSTGEEWQNFGFQVGSGRAKETWSGASLTVTGTTVPNFSTYSRLIKTVHFFGNPTQNRLTRTKNNGPNYSENIS